MNVDCDHEWVVERWGSEFSPGLGFDAMEFHLRCVACEGVAVASTVRTVTITRGEREAIVLA